MMKKLFACCALFCGIISLAAAPKWETLPQIAPGVKFDPAAAPAYPGMKVSIIQRPDAQYQFLHDTAIIQHKGVLYAAWYNCPEKEMAGTSVIRGRKSTDGGKTWSETFPMAVDPDPSWQYVPPAFLSTGEKLYLLVPRWQGEEGSHKTTLRIFELNEKDNTWKAFRTCDTKFLPNTNGFKMDNGKLIVGGRDTGANQPAVMIFDEGKVDGKWRVVLMSPPDKPNLPQLCPESSLTLNGKGELTCYVRCGMMIAFWVYKSLDYGETWQAYRHEIPVLKSKMNSGKLSDGRIYWIFNVRKFGRNRLFLALSKPGEKVYSSFYTLRADDDPALNAKPQWSYPSSVEYDGKLYITTTCRDGSPKYEKIVKSAAALIVLPLK